MTTSNETFLQFGRDLQGYNSYSPSFANYKLSASLSPAVATPFTVPSSHKKWIVVFSYSSVYNVWVSNNGTAGFPAGDSFALTDSELNPSPRLVNGGDVISCISANSVPEIGVLLYAVS